MSSNCIDIQNALGIPPLPSQSPDTVAALLWAREVLQKHQKCSGVDLTIFGPVEGNKNYPHMGR